MKGNILGFDADTNTGAISGHDGQRYEFVTQEWRGPAPPLRGETVDFVASGSRAAQIYPLGQRFNPVEADTANVIYILYLVSLLVGITSIVGVIMAYVNQGAAPEWVQSHYRFQIRTFWIGMLYGVIGVVTCIIIIGAFWLVFVAIWWIVRCVKGMQQISRGLPYEHPTTWLW
jgi:uncharacterized membrane protein